MIKHMMKSETPEPADRDQPRLLGVVIICED